jgi:hypothetical protein
VGKWLESGLLEFVHGHFTSSTDLLNSYSTWAGINMERSHTRTSFGMAMKMKQRSGDLPGVFYKHLNSARGFEGIRIKNSTGGIS